MTKDYIMEQLQLQKETLEVRGYDVAYIGLFGSQNYGLDLYTDEYQSDLDMKAVIVPTLDQLINNAKPVSFDKEIETGKIDVKDIRKFIQTLVKGNPAYLELLFTDYYIANDEFMQIRELGEDLVRCLSIPMLKASYGMAMEKRKAFQHPYPNIKWKIDKFGSDGKQLSHCIRLHDMCIEYFALNESYKKCIELPKNDEDIHAVLMDTKLNKYRLEYGLKLFDDTMDAFKRFVNSTMEVLKEEEFDYSPKDKINELKSKIIKDSIIRRILKGE